MFVKQERMNENIDLSLRKLWNTAQPNATDVAHREGITMRILFALVLFGHGVAHLPGFLVFWKLMTFKEMPYKTTIFAGNIHIGDMGIRIVGVFWLATALAFVASSIGIGIRLPWWQSVTLAVSVFSLLLCITGWPDARLGVFVNLALIAFLLVNRQTGWLA